MHHCTPLLAVLALPVVNENWNRHEREKGRPVVDLLEIGLGFVSCCGLSALREDVHSPHPPHGCPWDPMLRLKSCPGG